MMMMMMYASNPMSGDGERGKMFSSRDTDGTRAKGRRSNCSREIYFILEGTPPLRLTD